MRNHFLCQLLAPAAHRAGQRDHGKVGGDGATRQDAAPGASAIRPHEFGDIEEQTPQIHCEICSKALAGAA